ncbi:MAG: hypothetical protein VYB72_05850 [Planctomycetota bacterium]|nr:hypothetical protein [Planctomycetota bacterium]
MTRLLFGFLFALTLTFVTGCGGGSTEPTVVTGGPSETERDQQEEDYEAEMEGEEPEGDG